MRAPEVPLLFLGVTLLLAGCVQPDETDGEDILLPCPQWIHGPGDQDHNLTLSPEERDRNVTLTWPADAANGTWEGYVVDLYQIRLTDVQANATVELVARKSDGTQLMLRDYRGPSPQQVAVAKIGGAGGGPGILDVTVTPVNREPGIPEPAVLHLHLLGDVPAAVGLHVTLHYKVCGTL